MNIAEISIKKKTITMVLVVLALVGGILAYNSLGRLEDPEFTIKTATIFTPYPGASAREVEEEVTNIIEREVQKLGQIDYVESTSWRGMSQVKCNILDKYDKHALPQVWDEMRRKVKEAQGKLPPGAGVSMVNDDFGDVYGVYVAITGDGYSYSELKDVADLLRRELLLVQDVKRVDYWGDSPEAIYVVMKRDRMAQLGITEQQIFDALSAKNMPADGGRVKVGPEYLAINPTGEFKSEKEFMELLISAPGSDKQIYLGDVAEIERDYADPPNRLLTTSSKAFFRDGKELDDETIAGLDTREGLDVRLLENQPSIALGISTIEGGNVVVMGNALRKRLKELVPQIPLGIDIEVISMQPTSVTKSVNSFLINLVEAVIIVVVVLVLFMGFRSGVIIGFILLLTICASFVVMSTQGIMLQRISLGALIIALGMLVDNAIVVTDGIKVKITTGMDKLRAAREVVTQNQWPLLGATAVAIIAFAAIGLSQDSTGEYCKSLFQVVMISLGLSWLAAVTVTPLLCVMFIRPPKAKDGAAEKADPYGGKLFKMYRWVLERAVQFRWVTIIIVVSLFVAALIGFGQLKNSFFPDSTRPQYMVHLWMPEGEHIRDTQAAAKKVSEYLMGLDDAKSVATHVGGGATRFLLTYSPEEPNSAYALMIVTVYDHRRIEEMIGQTQKWLNENLTDGMGYCKAFRLGPGDGGTIQVRLSGPDTTVLRGLAEETMNIMKDDGGAIGIRTNWRQLVKVIRPVIAESPARRAGITRPQISQEIERSFEGVQVGYFREGTVPREDRIIPIIARPPEVERGNINSINNLSIYSPAADKSIPLRQVVTGFETKYENNIIRRRDRKPTIMIHCDQKSGVASALRNRIASKIEAMEFPVGYELEWGGEYEDTNKAQAGLARTLPVFLVLMILIVIILFNNLRQPLIIWLTVPLAIIGITAGRLIFDLPFGFMALLGALSLSGMLIKNAVVLIDQLNHNLKDEQRPYDAIISAGVSRMQPVMMAAATTVLGMLPLLTDAFFVAMAVAIMFGLTFATTLTLLFVPVLCATLYRVPYGGGKPRGEGGSTGLSHHRLD